MVTEAWLRQRGLLHPAHSCCPAYAKAACLYLLYHQATTSVVNNPSPAQHCSEPLLGFLCGSDSLPSCVLSVSSFPTLFVLPVPPFCFPSLPLVLPSDSHFGVLLTHTTHHTPQMHTHACSWFTAAVCTLSVWLIGRAVVKMQCCHRPPQQLK